MTTRTAVMGIGLLVMSACGNVRETSQTGTPDESTGGNGGLDAGPQTGGAGAGGRGAGGNGGNGASSSITRLCAGPCVTDDDCAECPGPATCTAGRCAPVCNPGAVVSHDVALGSVRQSELLEVLGAVEIHGNVTVEGDGMEDLRVLACLQHVVGNVSVGVLPQCFPSFSCVTYPSSELTSLSGLERLRSIDGDLSIVHNPRLASLEGLSGLEAVHRLFINAPLVTGLLPLRGLKNVANDLSITETGIATLDGLDSLSSVGGLMNIQSNPVLTSLSGLGALASVGAGFYIGANNLLESFAGLEHLNVVKGDFTTESNYLLRDFTGLSGLAEIGGQFGIQLNGGIQSFSGLGALRRIGSLRVNDERSLTSLAPLQSVTFVGDHVILDGVKALANLDGFPGITSLSGELTIGRAPALSDVRGVAKLTGAGSVSLSGVSELASLAGFEALTSVARLSIEDAPRLATLAPFSGLRGSVDRMFRNVAVTDLSGLAGVTGGFLILEENPALTSLNGFGSATMVTTLSLQSNPKLSSITALSSLGSVEGELVIIRNDALPSLAGLEGLATVTGSIDIAENPLVTTLTPLGGIHGKVTGLRISGGAFTDLQGLEGILGTETTLGIGNSNFDSSALGTAALTSLRGLEGITSVGSLWITRNKALVDLSGLANLKTVTSELTIRGNEALAQLGGLTGITSVGDQIAIWENTSLPNCEAVALVSRLNKTCGPNEVICQDVCTCPGNNGTGACP